MERMQLEQWKSKEVARLLALVETERRYYQEMIAALPVGLVVLAGDRSLVSANRAFRQMLGLRIEDLRQKAIQDLLPSDVLIEKIRDVNVNGISQPGFLLQWNEKLLRIAILPIRNWEDETEMETLLVLSDVSEVRSAPVSASQDARSVAGVDSSPRSITEALPAAVWRADASTFAFTNVAGDPGNLLGYPAVHWLSAPGFFAERIHPESRDSVLNHYKTAVATGTEASAEFRALTASGEFVWCRESVRASEPGILSGVLTPIPERKQLEQQQIVAERNAALHGLSARLAHDLNNPLMIITGYAEEMMQGLPAADPRRADLDQILQATQRIGGVTGQLLQFTRKQANSPQALELSGWLGKLKPKLVRAAGPGMPLEMSASAPLWASANREQMEEALLALVAAQRENAPDATRLTIACDSVRIAEFLETGTPLPPGNYARLTLHSDAGTKDPKRRFAFESIITDSGAALARAYSVVREWGGDIAFQSDPESGSTFLVYLPVAQPEPAPEKTGRAKTQAPAPAAAEQAFRETILVVDDEPGIRALVAKILRRERYLVLEAGTAMEAATVALIHGSPIQLLLTDVMLPDRNGRQLAEQLRESLPALKVLYISGFTDDESVRTGDFPQGSRFLQKPFTLGALVGTVREALDQ